MRRFLYLSTLIFCPVFLLFSTSVAVKEAREVATTEGLPSSIVNQSVCVISGEYTDSVLDVALPGPEALVIHRHYRSGSSRGNLGSSWSFNHGERLVLYEAIYDNEHDDRQNVWGIGLRQPSGTQLDYICSKSKAKDKKKRLRFDLIVPKGLTNGAESLSGRTNVQNQTVYFYPESDQIVAVAGSGDRRRFAKTGSTEEGWVTCTQKDEEKVNGSLYTYECTAKNITGLASIKCHSRKSDRLYSKIRFEQIDSSAETPAVALIASDGRKLKYRFKRHRFKIRTKTKTTEETNSMRSYYLTEVDHPYAPAEEYEYDSKAIGKEWHMVRKKRPEGRFVQTDYYRKGLNRVGGQVGAVSIEGKDDYRLDRVKRQQAPVGTDKKPVTTHRFVYRCEVQEHKGEEKWKELMQGATDVYDAYDHRTRYAYDKNHRLSCITRYAGTGDYTPYSKESFVWAEGDKQKGNLAGKIFKNGESAVHHARYFTYDANGNVLTSQLCGRLTGQPAAVLALDSSEYPIENGYECEKKAYTYSEDGLNLLLSEVDSSGKGVIYHYLRGTDRLEAKYVVYGGQIQLREFYTYDDDYALIEKITDDGKNASSQDLTGVTERRYAAISPRRTPPMGLAESLEESGLDLATGQKKLISRKHFDYSPEGNLLAEEVFDADSQLAYVLRWEYDAHGNITSETNALGETIVKQYDANDNLIFQQGPSAHFHIENAYDFANRLIRQEEVHADGQRFTTTHTYDYLGQCIATTDPYGHETRRTFDDFGRVTATTHPSVVSGDQLITPVTTTVYDLAGYPICRTDAKGRQAWTEFNIRGQPTKVAHPDGTEEQFTYTLDGQLAQKMEKNGTRVVFIRDPLGRVVDESSYSADGQLLKQTRHGYNALHLLHTIDAEGGNTYYTYDSAGRLEWTFQEGSRQHILYDPLGRPSEIREWFGDQSHEYRATVKTYDLLDRVLEERLQASDGSLLHLARYAYDASGNRTLEQTGEQKTWTAYDAHQNPITITNGLGQVTHIAYRHHFVDPYGQRVLQTVTTDPLGYQTIDTYDTAHRLVETLRANPFGSLIARYATEYDLCGNPVRVSEAVVEQGQTRRTLETFYLYNENDQLTALVEAAHTPEQKITQTLYNSFGQKSSTLKPNGQALLFEYDALGRLKSLKSSDNTISYLYDYNRLDQVVRAADLQSGLTTERFYDSLGQLVKETLGHGLSLSYTYDKIGRVRTLFLPDQTGIEYTYDAVDLKETHRLINGQRAYTHCDLAHTLSGQITQTRLAGNNGEVRYAYDSVGRCTAIDAAQYHQSVPPDGFDAAGNLVRLCAQDISYAFSYDDYYQLQSEIGHTTHAYQNDSLFNRKVKDGESHLHNSLNQLLQKGNTCFTYDANGNLTARTQEGTTYAYDALDRLTTVTQGGKSIQYLYDAFNRRLIKRQLGEEDRLFLYQGQEEIGSWTQGAFETLKVLGKNPRSSAVALEIKGALYVPLHDLFGNIICLLDAQGQPAERYRYTSFGETQLLSSSGELLSTSAVGNPWQYAGKRLETETGLVAFGLRDYDPSLGRWITPDPAGFTDGSNLYAYVHNSPLLQHDEFGLYSMSGPYALSPNEHSSTFSKGYAPDPAFSYQPKVRHFSFEDRLEARYNFRASKPHGPRAPFERTASYSLNDMGLINPSTQAPFQLNENPDKCIIFHNGIQNKRSDFNKSLSYLGRLANHNIQGVHGASFGLAIDAHCYFNALSQYIAYEAVRELHKQWHDFFKKSSANATLLMIAHSRGVVYVRNALMDFPPELRQRIEVLAVAPAGYIESYLCKSVTHYASKRDIVPLLDRAGRARCRETIVTLTPHPNASRWLDHSFTSPTYQKHLRMDMERYLTQ